MDIPDRAWALLALPMIVLVVPDVAAAGADTVSDTPATLTAIARMVGALMLVLLAFWLCAWLIRLLQNRGAMGGSSSGLAIITSVSVGSRERIVVVQAGSQQILVGVTPQAINTLHVLPEPLEGSDEPAVSVFAGQLSRALGRGSPASETS